MKTRIVKKEYYNKDAELYSFRYIPQYKNWLGIWVAFEYTLHTWMFSCKTNYSFKACAEAQQLIDKKLAGKIFQDTVKTVVDCEEK